MELVKLSLAFCFFYISLIMVAAIIIGCIIYLIGGAFQTGAANLNYLWAGRWIAGLGVGFLVMIVPIYQYVLLQYASLPIHASSMEIYTEICISNFDLQI
jgi:hypothetical protein